MDQFENHIQIKLYLVYCNLVDKLNINLILKVIMLKKSLLNLTPKLKFLLF